MVQRLEMQEAIDLCKKLYNLDISLGFVLPSSTMTCGEYQVSFCDYRHLAAPHKKVAVVVYKGEYAVPIHRFNVHV